jgi:hyperosmotically inducible protein
VRGVSNSIAIKPHVKAADVKKKIEEALRRHAEVEASAIRVTVHDNDKVTLEGTVNHWDERYAAENAAWSAPGVKSVDDRLAIV